MNHRKRNGVPIGDPTLIRDLRRTGTCWLAAAGCLAASSLALVLRLVFWPWEGWGSVPSIIVVVANLAVALAAVVQWQVNSAYIEKLRRKRYGQSPSTAIFKAMEL